MTPALELARHYFELSNLSDFDRIAPLFDAKSTFRTRSGDYFIGVDDIMAMQKSHHGSYKKLHWQVTQVEEVKLGVVRFEFDFKAETHSGEHLEFSGIEYVLITDGKIRHIDVLAAQ